MLSKLSSHGHELVHSCKHSIHLLWERSKVLGFLARLSSAFTSSSSSRAFPGATPSSTETLETALILICSDLSDLSLGQRGNRLVHSARLQARHASEQRMTSAHAKQLPACDFCCCLANETTKPSLKSIYEVHSWKSLNCAKIHEGCHAGHLAKPHGLPIRIKLNRLADGVEIRWPDFCMQR